jgi:xylulokinase
LTGGGAKSRFWRELCAEAFGVPVLTLRHDEGAALGAAICAAWCVARHDGSKTSAAAAAESLLGA